MASFPEAVVVPDPRRIARSSGAFGSPLPPDVRCRFPEPDPAGARVDSRRFPELGRYLVTPLILRPDCLGAFRISLGPSGRGHRTTSSPGLHPILLSDEAEEMPPDERPGLGELIISATVPHRGRSGHRPRRGPRS